MLSTGFSIAGIAFAPRVPECTHKVRVDVRTIDDVLLSLGIFKVDFIKLDVEDAELSVLRGATGLLQGPSRPAILASGPANASVGICGKRHF